MRARAHDRMDRRVHECVCPQRDHGQAAMLGLMWIAIAAVLVAALLGFAARLGEAQRAQHAADAVALAAVDGDRVLAERVATLDGAQVVSIGWHDDIDGAWVEVTVRVGQHVATARASRSP